LIFVSILKESNSSGDDDVVTVQSDEVFGLHVLKRVNELVLAVQELTTALFVELLCFWELEISLPQGRDWYSAGSSC